MMNKIKRLIRLIYNVAVSLLSKGVLTTKARRRALMVWRLRDVKYGKRVIAGANVTILNRKNLRLGDDVMLTNNILFSCAAPVEIGNKVMIGPGTVLHTTTHDLISKVAIHEKIVINDGVWIAANATITSGVTIGKNSVIAAGAVVSGDIPSGVLVGGVPAKIIKTIGDDIDAHERFTQSEWTERFN